jgi:hypothetical protein
MQIDESDKQNANAEFSICDSLEAAPKVTPESTVHQAKQPSQRHSTDEGIQINDSEEQWRNADL